MAPDPVAGDALHLKLLSLTPQSREVTHHEDWIMNMLRPLVSG